MARTDVRTLPLIAADGRRSRDSTREVASATHAGLSVCGANVAGYRAPPTARTLHNRSTRGV